jgi:protein-tyrosine phosphatase
MKAKSTGQPPPDHSHPYEILPGLYISGHPDRTRDFMSKGVSAVIDLEGDVDTSIPQQEKQQETTLYLYWPIEDAEMPDPSIVRSIAAFVAGLMDAGDKVLVHCQAGHNRSGLICARTLIARGMDARDAIATVQAKRGDGHALENENFVRWLLHEKAGGAGGGRLRGTPPV